MKHYVIDGMYLTRQITGIQRFANMIILEMDEYLSGNEQIVILVPNSYNGKVCYKHIEIIKYGFHVGKVWEQWDFAEYLKKHGAYGIFFENSITLGYRKGIIVLHDVSLRVNMRLFCKSPMRLLSIIWYRINYKMIADSSMKIVTVSNFSKNEIMRYYKVDPNRIYVINNAWQHIMNCIEDDSIFQNENRIIPNSYYFALSSIAPNKNFKWIFQAALKNPNEVFVVSGKGDKNVIKEFETIENIVYVGYVSDAVAKALMKKCKGFIFPSLYEGFGIPPLEAIASGCRSIIVSDIICMHEIYGKYATYIDPYNYDIDFKSIDNSYKGPYDQLLDKYSWKKSAKALLNILYEDG